MSLRQADLARRLGLVAEVPCAGSDLQGRCRLLGDAREAQALVPSVGAQIVALSERRRAMEAERAAVAEQLVPLATAAERRNEAEKRLESARSRASRLARLAARQGEVLQSQAALPAVEAELPHLAQTPPAETDEEATERADITAARDRIAREREGVMVARDEAIARVDTALAALPAAFDGRRVSRSREASADARRCHQDAEQAHLSAAQRTTRMSITFELEIRDTVEALNLSNANAAALMTLAGLAPRAVGEVRGDSLRACAARLLRVVNCEAARAPAIAGGSQSLRWYEGGRSDEYLQRRAAELLALLVSAQRQGCGVHRSSTRAMDSPDSGRWPSRRVLTPATHLAIVCIPVVYAT